MANDDKKYDRTPPWKKCLEVVALAVLTIYTTFAGMQWYGMHRALRVDQRAWLSVVGPGNFPLDGSSIPMSVQIANTGKTPAQHIEGDIVATVLKKGEEPSLDFSTGHPHNRVYAGAVFPNGTINLIIPVVRYGPQRSETIVPTPELREEIANGESFLIFYGKVTYFDIFGNSHWTSFCTGSGSAMGDLKKCLDYNEVDDN